MKLTRVGLGSLMAGLAGLSAVPVSAQDKDLSFKVGPLWLRPHGVLEERFDDNIFYDSSNRQHDLITFVTPGLSFILGDKEFNYLLLDYTQNYYFYADNSSINDLDHSVLLQGLWKGNHVELKGKTSFQDLSSVIGGQVSIRTPINRDVYLNDYRFSYVYSDKTTAYLNVSHDGTDYEKGTSLIDYDTVRGTLGLQYQIFPKTRAYSEVYYGRAWTGANLPTIANGPQSSFVGGFIGVTGDISARLVYDAKVGYEVRDYSNHTPVPDAVVANVSLSYKISERAHAQINYARGNIVSIEDPGVTGLSDSVGFDVTQKLGHADKISISLAGTYVVNAYESLLYPGRNDENFRIALAGLWKFRPWIAAKAGYEFEGFDSTFSGVRDYHANRLYVQLIFGSLAL